MKYLVDALNLAEHLKRYFKENGADNFTIMLLTRLVNESAREVREELPLFFKDKQAN